MTENNKEGMNEVIQENTNEKKELISKEELEERLKHYRDDYSYKKTDEVQTSTDKQTGVNAKSKLKAGGWISPVINYLQFGIISGHIKKEIVISGLEEIVKSIKIRKQEQSRLTEKDLEYKDPITGELKRKLQFPTADRDVEALSALIEIALEEINPEKNKIKYENTQTS